MACVVMLAAACGSAASSSGTAHLSRHQQMLNYSKCMRQHGVPDFPDPDSNGNIGNYQPHVSNSVYQAADNLCVRLQSAGCNCGQRTQHDIQMQEARLLSYARCMRSHGVPNFPDPRAPQSGSDGTTSFGFPPVHGLDLKSPQVGVADQACKSLQSGGGRSGSGSGS